MGVKVALKAKYATRRAVDKVLYHEDELVDIVELEVARHLLSQLDTALVALYVDDKFYPVNKDNYEEQFELALAEEALTVDEDPDFGVLKLSNFASALEETDDLKKFQDEVEVYNGIVKGTCYLVEDYEALGVDAITKNGYWFAFAFDTGAAEEAGYSDLKFFVSQEEVKDENYVYLGATETAAKAALLTIVGKYTAPTEASNDDEEPAEEAEPVDATLAFDVRLKMVVRKVTYEDPNYVPEEPEEPENPDNPEDPQEPTDPDNPEEPVDPENPDNPTDPEEP